MGVDTRRPTLPAPTESSTLESAVESVTGTDLATDISRRTDQTSHTIPDDGSPITVTTTKKPSTSGKLTKSHHHSQTSLLIEYFEGEKGPSLTSRPSVRVKVTPSAARKLKDKHDGHIVVTEAHGPRKTSYSRRISLATDSPSQAAGEESGSSLTSLGEHGHSPSRGPPVEIELLDGNISELSGSSVSKEARYIVPPSDISSMPPDSMLDGNAPPPLHVPPRTMTAAERSRSASREMVMDTNMLKTLSRRRSRSLSRERRTQKVIDKLVDKPRETGRGSRRKHGDKSRSRSVSKEVLEADSKSSRTRSRRHREDESLTTGADSTLISNSLLSANRKSGDQYSFRSGTSKSSINNPKLLETVEDAIRRLILPELKELKKDQKVASSRSKFDSDPSPLRVSGSHVSGDEVVRRVSEHESAKEMKHKLLSRDSNDSVELPSNGSGRRERRQKDVDLDSTSERSYSRRGSGDSVSIEGSKNRRKSSKEYRLRDAAAGAMVGGALTAAALKRHESKSSVDYNENYDDHSSHGRQERRKRRSKSRSRSASIPESEEVLYKHEAPPMPMRSEIDSELTRSSLLSEQTANTTTPSYREVREVIRGSPREVLSPAPRTPTRTPIDLRKGLGTHHGNFSNRDLSLRRDEGEAEMERYTPGHGGDSKLKDAAFATGTGSFGDLATSSLLDDPERVRAYESNLHQQHPIRRGLSPIQSVASYTTTEPNRNSMTQARSIGSLSSLNKEQHLKEEMSIDSLSSAPSTDLARSKRPAGISLENRSEILGQLRPTYRDKSPNLETEAFYDEQHSQNERYRDSYAGSDPRDDITHMMNYPDDGLNDPYLDKVTAGQQVAQGYGAIPEYVHTPPGVESAVASLCGPSLVDVRGSQSPSRSLVGSNERPEVESPKSISREMNVSARGSPLRQHYTSTAYHEKSFHQRAGAASPPQSVTHSSDERDDTQADVANVLQAGVLQAEGTQAVESPQSEVTTNPSVIQGPIGGVPHENRDHWPYNPTPPRSKGERDVQSPAGELPGGANGPGLGAATMNSHGREKDVEVDYNHLHDLNIEKTQQAHQDFYSRDHSAPTSPGMKDEGYITGDNPREPSPHIPALRSANADYAGGKGGMNDKSPAEDILVTKRNRHLSGFSDGMDSHFYDGATGQGIERIQSQDIVALMDHLTVRDAQRNARDTEILVTLVRSAAEMRNSFEDMKRFIAEQDDLIMDTADVQHEKTQKVVGGPRPPPLASSKFQRQSTSEEGEDTPTKRKSVFKRALRGLSSKNSNELQNMEAMLMQLLDNVEDLRTVQSGRPVAQHGTNPNSLNSTDNLRAPTDAGYEPEGQAGTSSTGDRSGFFSNNSSRQADHRGAGGGRRDSGNRVSTVMEGDEDADEEIHGQRILHEQPTYEPHLLSPGRDVHRSRENNRGGSVPLGTPPRVHQQNAGTLSNDNTPHMSSDSKSNRKHKSTSSSFFPKISRWSKTTASSFGDNFRMSGQNTSKARPYSQTSQSGSNLGEYDYDPQGDDGLRSNNSLANEEYHGQENRRPHSPLIPSHVSDDPKYQAHRNSLNLQHPQPRQGPTGRFQHHLEKEAQYYGEDQFSPTSQTSSQWDNQPGLATADANTNPDRRYSGHGGTLSPISDAGYSETSSSMMDLGEQQHARSVKSGASASSLGSGAPPRPPKVRDEEPLVPQRPPKIAMSPGGGRQPTYVDHVTAARGSPAYDKSPIAALRSSPGQGRKPSGPRPFNASGHFSPNTKGDPNAVKRTRFRGSPNQVES